MSTTKRWFLVPAPRKGRVLRFRRPSTKGPQKAS